MIDEYYKKKKEYDKIGNNRRKGILSLLGSYEGKKILDVGCGMGHLGRILKENTQCIVDGIDISEDAIRNASDVLDSSYVADLEHGNLPDALVQSTYDVIVISEVLEHLFYPEKILSKISHLCTKDTKVIVTVPNILFIKNRIRILFGSFEYAESGLMDRGHIHFFSWKSLGEMIRSEHFKMIHTQHNFPMRFTKILGRVFPGVFAKQFIISLQYEN